MASPKKLVALIVVFCTAHQHTNGLQNKKFHLKDARHNFYLKIEPGSKILTLVQNSEDQNQNSYYSKMEDMTWFTGCNGFIGGNEDEICEAQNEFHRLYYDKKHKIYIILEPKYSNENHHGCHMKNFGHEIKINCGIGDLHAKKTHKIGIGSPTFFQIENLSHYSHSNQRIKKVPLILKKNLKKTSKFNAKVWAKMIYILSDGKYTISHT